MKTLLIALLLSSTVVVDNKTYKDITDLTLTANLVCFKQADKVYCFSKNRVVLDGKQLEKEAPVRVYIEREPVPTRYISFWEDFHQRSLQKEVDKSMHDHVLQKIEEQYILERSEPLGYNDAGLNMPALQNYSDLLAEEGMDNDWVETIIAEGYL